MAVSAASMRSLLLASLVAAMLSACTSGVGPTEDAAAMADAPVTDAATCTTLPGDLPGMRSVAAGALLPDLAFESASGSVHLTDFHVPCAPRAELIVVRSLASWSGPSRWHAAHTARLAAVPDRARVHFVDLLVEDEDALPAAREDLDALTALYDASPDALALDPGETFGALAFAGTRMPVVALIDARTLRLVRLLFGPRAGEIEDTIAHVLAMLDGAPPPSPYSPTLVDGRFSEDEWDMIQAMRYPATPPPDASNAHADDPAAAALGGMLVADASLSPAGVSCASCHDPAHGLADGRPVGHGVADVTRNTPTLYASAHARWAFWDGRADSLWAQAIGPMESAREMGSSRLFVAHRIVDGYRASYEPVFGTLPDLSDGVRFPPSGAPGDPAWDAMSATDQDAVLRIVTDAGKAIEAYERTLAPPRTRFDDYVAGDLSALSDLERDGLHELFFVGCAECHWGPALSDSAFHDVLMPGAGTDAALDVGRSAALDVLRASAFRRQGAFSDAPTSPDPLGAVTTSDPSTVGAFRTPTLRALAQTAPYGHAGTFTTLHDVADHYARIRALPADPHVAGVLDTHVVGFDPAPSRLDALVALLSAL